MKTLIGYLFSIVSLSVAHAEVVVTPPTNNLPDINAGEPTDVIAVLITYGIGITGVLAIIAITWASITVIIGSGDEEKMKRGRKMIIYGLIGVLIAGMAYLIVNMIGNLSLE